MAVTTITASGAGSQSFGAGTLVIEVWGGGSTGSWDGVNFVAWTNGGGAYSKVTLTLGSTTTVYYSNAAQTFGNNTAGNDTWANSVSNAAPTLTTQGALAKGGNNGSSASPGTGGQASSGVGTTKYSGGAGNRYDLNTGPNSGANYALPGGGGGAGPTGDGAQSTAFPAGGLGNIGNDGGSGEVTNGASTLVAPSTAVAPGGAGGTGIFTPGSAGARGEIVFTHTPATQTLTPSLFTNTSTFYAPTINRGAVTLTPSLFTNSSTFYGPTINRGAVTLSPPLFSNTNTFYAPTVSQSGGGQSLTPGLLSNTNAFYGPMITAGVVTVSPGLLTNSNTFYNPTVSMGAVTLTPGLLTNTNSFFAPTITTGSVTLSPGLLTNANTFYAPAVTQPGGAVLWTPADYTGGELESWHDPSEPGGLTVSGGAVSQDDDLSGNGYHDTQGFGPLQPAIATADLNGLDVEDFAGGKSFGSTLPSDATTQTLLVLGKWSGSGPATLFGSTSGSLQFGVNSSGNLFLNRQGVAGIGNSTGALVVSGAWAIMVATYDKTTGAYSFRVNGTPCGSGTNIQTLDPSTFIIGNNGHFGGEAWSDKISERSALNTADAGAIEKWEGYVAWKYGLEGDLDAGHTYKSAAPTVGPGSQTLTPGLLTNTNTFFNPTVTPGSVTLSPGLLANSNALYAPTVTPGAATLSAGLLTNASVFYGPTVNQPSLQTLTPGLLTNVSVFYPPAANQNDPPGTYPLSIEGGGSVVKSAISGGGSVVAGSITSTGRVVAGYLRGRP